MNGSNTYNSEDVFVKQEPISEDYFEEAHSDLTIKEEPLFFNNPEFQIKIEEENISRRPPFSCPHSGCLSPFKSASQLKKHLNTAHVASSILICTVNGCGVKLRKSHNLLKLHLLDCHSITPKNIRRYALECRETDDIGIECPKQGCLASFWHANVLIKHLKEVHCLVCTVLQTCPVEGCGTQLERPLLLKHISEWHLIKNEEEEKLHCINCSATFTGIEMLQIHHEEFHKKTR